MRGKGPDVTVIVPVFRDRAGLLRLLDALRRQTAPPSSFEVLVVDNTPTPAFADLDGHLPNLRVLHEPKPGSYAARNKGLAEARGRLLAFTDSDCIPADDWVEAGRRVLDAHPEVAMVGGHIDLTYLDPERPRAVEVYQVEFGFDQRRCVEAGHHALTANLWTRPQTMAQAGPFNDGLKGGGDLDWGHRVHRLGLRQLYSDEVRVAHPARSRARDMGQKVRRMIGSSRDVHRLRKRARRDGSAASTGAAMPEARQHGYLLGLLVSALLPGPAMLRLIRDGHLRSPLLVLRYLGLWAYLAGLHVTEPIRLALGGASER